MPEAKTHRLELGIEFCLELATVMYQLGAEQMGLPHNFGIGLTLWMIAIALVLRILWIFPWVEKWPSWVKIAAATIGVAVLVVFAWSPVEHSYHKRGIPRGDSQQKPSVKQSNQGNNDTNIIGNGNKVGNTYDNAAAPKF